MVQMLYLFLRCDELLGSDVNYQSVYSKRFTNRNLFKWLVFMILFQHKLNNILLLGLIPFVSFEFKVLKVLNRPVWVIKDYRFRYKFVFYLYYE